MTVISKAVMALSLTCVAATGFSQVLFTYGNKPVTKNEFLKAYRKNNTESKPTDQSYSDYLELYIRFKLKVQAAYDMKLDTTSGQLAELQSFRNQVAETYVKDEGSINELINEAIIRSKKDIHLAHIFIAVSKSATDEEVKKAQEKIEAAYARLKKGEDFSKVATEMSQDPAVATNKGDIGYITVMVLPYDLETTVYATPVGKFSAPVRSKVGFHIFKNLGERPAVGRMKAAQILLPFPPGATDDQKQEIKKRADSIYNVLTQGSDFKALVTKFTGDHLTYQTGGEMMEFGVGQYELPFENAVFALKKDGEISRPILTEYGYHIVKRIQLKPVIGDTANAAAKEEFKQKILQNDRLEVSRKLLLKKVLQTIHFKKLPVNEQHLWVITDSALQNKRIPQFTDVTDKTPLFSFTKKTVTVKDWKMYLENIRQYENVKAGKTKQQLLDEFIEGSAFDYYRAHLEEYDKDFAYQLNEFREGNLLFEIMQRKIWDVAATDSAGLVTYYSAHKDKYWWESSADAIILTASNARVAEEYRNKMKENYKDWSKYIETSSGQLQGDSGRFELGQIPVAERTNFTEGLITANVKNQTDSSVAFAYIVKLHSDREQRAFADARGFVINDYQVFLEEQWINELKKKYPVNINETIVKGLPK